MARPNLFVATSRIEASAAELFLWHAEPSALERLTPPWESVEIVERSPGIMNGDSGVMRVRLGPFKIRWAFEHRDFIQDRQFRDVQTAGPFRRWEHTHLFSPNGKEACQLEDRIEYELPFGWLGDICGGWMVRRRLARVFEYRHKITADAMRLRKRGG